ncbi:ATP-dependent zinc protease [Hyphococcus sp.]|uniref:ATP-dependent zinc protease family protein n=1 Tax=Hyphococcus sp. TaxID=2038636 RepID=UPI003CCB7F61
MPIRPFLAGAGLTVILAANAIAADDDARGEPVTFGYIENVAVGNLGLEMKGKLDTGADTSSVHAYDVEVYKRGKRDNWVKFRLIGKDGRAIRYDQNVIRFANIKTKTGGSIRRPVIHLPVCVGGRIATAEVNLADRGDFEYDILIGREFLSNRILVDSSRTFMAEEICEPLDED